VLRQQLAVLTQGRPRPKALRRFPAVLGRAVQNLAEMERGARVGPSGDGNTFRFAGGMMTSDDDDDALRRACLILRARLGTAAPPRPRRARNSERKLTINARSMADLDSDAAQWARDAGLVDPHNPLILRADRVLSRHSRARGLDNDLHQIEFFIRYRF
jgi:hypothetical protein